MDVVDRLTSSSPDGYSPLDQYKQAYNYTAANRSSEIKKIVIHRAEGSYQGTIDWFASSTNKKNSAHYVLSNTGLAAQCVLEKDIAWHAGHWDTNAASVGIEFEGYVTQTVPEAMYRTAARMCAYLCKKYSLPVDRTTIIGHSEVPGCSTPGAGGISCHTDPGKLFNWEYFMGLVAEERAALEPPPPPTPEPDPLPPSEVVRVNSKEFVQRMTDLTVTERRNAAFDVVSNQNIVGHWRGAQWLKTQQTYEEWKNR